MADVILSPVIQVVLESLISTIKNKVTQVWGVEQELENLSNTLSTIMDVVEDAEEKQVKDKRVRNWLKNIKDAAYEIENILDEYNIEASRREAKHTTGCHNIQVSNFLPCVCFSKVAFRCSIGHKIRDIYERLRKIAELRSNYDLRVGVSEKVVKIRETDSFVDESTVLGRKDDKGRIVDLLLSSDDEDSRDDVSVIPIIGMGGLGKTTLAQLVYNDERVKKNFQLRMWVCVSEDFEIKRLVKEIIESGTETTCELTMSLDRLQHCLRETLIGRRFLLVLDDVWNEDQSKWETLMDRLRSGAKGSRMIVTTRHKKASPNMGTIHPVHLECLSEEDCWSLFAQRAFSHRIGEVEPKLIEIGKGIVKKCKGLPLAAKTLGSMMHFKRNETEWLEVRDSETWTLWKEEDGILNALRISYNHLPVHLKQCFIYCSLYPKDHEIGKEKLIKLWMAQGFIQPYRGSDKRLEDIGTDYFTDLLWRSFFQDVKRDGVGNIISCKMHDLVHDLAQYFAKDECSIIQQGKELETSANKTYHLSSLDDIPDRLYTYSYLRTFLLLDPPTNIIPKHLVDLFLNLGCLRALDLSRCDIKKLPNSIGNLKHLRYLNLRGNDFKELPETTSNLCNLQTLNITHCHSLTKLPKCMKNMTSLRHLQMDDDYERMKHMPNEIGKLTCLQTLPFYIVGKENGCGLGELQDLNLRGTLTIRRLENVKNMEEAKKANLKRKQHLHTLRFQWKHGRGQNNAREEEVVLEGFEPHTNLRSLSIRNYGGSKFPSWMRNSSQEFPSLEELKLSNLYNLEDWSKSGEVNLHCLRKLDIYYYPKLSALPKLPLLEELRLNGMPDLENLPMSTGEGNSSRLSKLYIQDCPKLRALHQLTNLIELELVSCDDMLSLEHLPSSLKILEIKMCDNITSLPDGLLQNLTALECLKLHRMANITSLPESIENLSALAHFEICECPKLESLPEGLKHLSALEDLGIYNCPLLRERCREGGEDWHKIAHISHKYIDLE